MSGRILRSASHFWAFNVRNSRCWTKLLRVTSSTINFSHTSCISLALEEVKIPESTKFLTCTLGSCRSISSLRLVALDGIYPCGKAAVSLRSGTGNQFAGIFVTVYHDACIESLLLRLILFTFRIKLKAPPPSNEWFYFEPPLSWQQFYVMPPPSSFSAPLLVIIAQSLIMNLKYASYTCLFT